MEGYIRQARFSDMEKIVEIFESGRQFLKEQGLPQWQDGEGPNRALAERDIENGHGYVLVFQGQVAGYASLVPSPDGSPPLTEGEWQPGHDRHVVIHRVALDGTLRGRGLSQQFLRDIVIAAGLLGYQDVRIDTHPGNMIMRKITEKTGFLYKGLMHLPIANGERLAYQIVFD